MKILTLVPTPDSRSVFTSLPTRIFDPHYANCGNGRKAGAGSQRIGNQSATSNESPKAAALLKKEASLKARFLVIGGGALRQSLETQSASAGSAFLAIVTIPKSFTWRWILSR